MRSIPVATLLVALLAPAAQGSQCVNFDFFCDALQLEASGRDITGVWLNWDCQGAEAPVTGRIEEDRVLVFCTDDLLCPPGQEPGADLGFILVPFSFDLFQLLGDNSLVQLVDDSPFSLFGGGICQGQPIGEGIIEGSHGTGRAPTR